MLLTMLSQPFEVPTLSSSPLPMPVLLKALAVLAAGFSVHTFNAPPHGMSHKKQARDEQVLGEPMKVEPVVQVMVPLLKNLAWVAPAVELYLSLQRGQTEGWSVTPRMLIGAGIGLYSAYIRHRCYAALGERFTLGLSTYKAQKLPLVTGGPYAIVRHASYTAVIMAMWSASMVLLDPTSSISNATGAWWPVRLALYSLTIFQTFFFPVWRIPNEEKMLSEEFGAEWDLYTKRTRWALVPGFW